MRNLRPAALLISIALLGAAAAGAATAAQTEPTVSCDRIVLRGRSGTEDGFRVLLGAVSVPGARHLASGSAKAPNGPWPYFHNAGLAVRGGTSDVSVTVPEGWRDRVAISWGDSGATSALRFAPCGGSPGTWNAYSGGFHLRGRSDCIPLIVRVGGLTTTVRVGVGRACGERR